MPSVTPATEPAHPILRNDYAAEWLGIEVLEVKPGRVRIQMTVRREMLNGFGITHGGMVFALADTAFALACNDPDGDGSSSTVATGAEISFLKATHVGQRLIATAELRTRQGRTGIYDVRVTAESGGHEVIIAEFRGRSRTVHNTAIAKKK